jgi:hypothetical protein
MRITCVSDDPPHQEAPPDQHPNQRQARRRADLIARYAAIPLDRDHLEERFALLLHLAEARATR